MSLQRIYTYLTPLLLLACSPKASLPPLSAQEVLQLVDEQSYQFKMEYVQPMGGRQRMITGNYTLSVRKDQIDADLPYFGRAFQAPIGATDGGIKFTSTDFSYNSTTGKGERREINIQPRDNRDITAINMVIFSNGRADVKISSVNRQPISYTGNINRLP